VAAAAAAVAALGPWLAAGCVSTRRVVADLGGGGEDAHVWAPLAWRDYWRLSLAASGAGVGKGVAAVPC
jgi:deoxyribodipyrimidine photolyase